MAGPPHKRATYDDLYTIPEHSVGQIIDGELIVTPPQSRHHALAAGVLSAKVSWSYVLGKDGGPGGWIVLFGSEVKLGEDILVPDLAGWRKERFPEVEETNWISVCPDWVCEILSPSTIRVDKIKKMTIYARHNVGHFWLIDPAAKTLDVLRLESGRWVVLGVYADNDKVRAEPFEQAEISLGSLWLEQAVATKSASSE
ncbi:MAG: Uma2 family endonuclease [Syntrophobacteraceae bacterium]